MKKTLTYLVAIALISLFSFKIATNLATAETEQFQGVYVFYKSRPVAQYDYIATIKANGIVNSYRATDLMNNIFKQLKKKHPEANGVIFTQDFMQCDAIKLKE